MILDTRERDRKWEWEQEQEWERDREWNHVVLVVTVGRNEDIDLRLVVGDVEDSLLLDVMKIFVADPTVADVAAMVAGWSSLSSCWRSSSWIVDYFECC